MISTPFYLWLGIFSVQPHKEERFMYPAYPFLCLNAALTVHTVLNYLGHPSPKSIVGQVPAKLRLALVSVFVLATTTVGVLRTVGSVSAYSAPLNVYRPLQMSEYAGTQANVCLGKEWHRFPSSYFLPITMRAKFVKSAFDGLLPGEFSEARAVSGIVPTRLIPPGMNDQNIEDPDKHVRLSRMFFCLSIANLSRSILVTARSWWTPLSLNSNLGHWSQIISSMKEVGNGYGVINFLTPRKHSYWAASSGYLTGKSFQRNFEDNGACIVSCVESRPLSDTRTSTQPHCPIT